MRCTGQHISPILLLETSFQGIGKKVSQTPSFFRSALPLLAIFCLFSGALRCSWGADHFMLLAIMDNYAAAHSPHRPRSFTGRKHSQPLHRACISPNRSSSSSASSKSSVASVSWICPSSVRNTSSGDHSPQPGQTNLLPKRGRKVISSTSTGPTSQAKTLRHFLQ